MFVPLAENLLQIEKSFSIPTVRHFSANRSLFTGFAKRNSLANFFPKPIRRGDVPLSIGMVDFVGGKNSLCSELGCRWAAYRLHFTRVIWRSSKRWLSKNVSHTIACLVWDTRQSLPLHNLLRFQAIPNQNLSQALDSFSVERKKYLLKILHFLHPASARLYGTHQFRRMASDANRASAARRLGCPASVSCDFSLSMHIDRTVFWKAYASMLLGTRSA